MPHYIVPASGTYIVTDTSDREQEAVSLPQGSLINLVETEFALHEIDGGAYGNFEQHGAAFGPATVQPNFLLAPPTTPSGVQEYPPINTDNIYYSNTIASQLVPNNIAISNSIDLLKQELVEIKKTLEEQRSLINFLIDTLDDKGLIRNG